ncbi:gamma-glutamyl-gamma-aminobutyrate hydrolase family protein [Leucobacter sp. wl10]|uniref:gamma-glutamyl-gamma-aminobutyrate hydrolase family protein n=1 Tax=Leucobacter sp. wl10 TaxID=2304677 RepID=UPI000E5AEC7D|nr:gamma-glutamyl-gamma-aminobutyrate hydrolase family protein [Leucobacter sp. wl10]RGE24344.1 gamma-glutamyl-gamma-aminobutyrate hydrolase family protein [Leucobacter sp. wl10]
MGALRGDRVPRIGVTGMWSKQIRGLRFDGSAVAAAVLRSVIRAGGEPLALFAESVMQPEERLRGLDALLVPGGSDVDPRRYGQRPLEATSPADFAAQDGFEAGMMAAAIRIGLPTLAICRGFQLLNVEHGGTLVQDLDAHSVHRDAVHAVGVDPGSALAAASGASELSVSSYHHQAIDRVGEGLRVTGRAPDGVVEALEHPSAPLIAVQWHPEDGAGEDERQHALFVWLVDEARARMA